MWQAWGNPIVRQGGYRKCLGSNRHQQMPGLKLMPGGATLIQGLVQAIA